MAILDVVTKTLRYRQLAKTLHAHFGDEAKLKGLKCLNVGGGYGGAHQILERFGFEVTTCDIDGSCDYCDLNQPLSYADDSFDVVICLAVLEHLHDWQNGLEELKRVAKHLVIATTPSVYGKPVLETLAFIHLVNKDHIDDHKYYLSKQDIVKAGYQHRYFTFLMNQLAVFRKSN
ncbi:class I SAM-dependent methyltransferase [Hydrogenovibrio kuenenii]|uniref:class I SAM-dependent methyltransferase n=1 Tax=Hydrogenovibrio kuenenii TaxID=63658 RepID=UPI000463D599|nr:class I SAM-dependent methyltransferase [Hydrogenovibrio kuenenii]